MCFECVRAKSRLEEERLKMEQVREEYERAWGKYKEAYHEHHMMANSCIKRMTL